MDTARIAFLKAIKSFPRWMDIRKRPQKATGSKLLQAIMDEQDNFKVALDKFKSDFFLLSYVGREDTILSEVYVYQIGEVDASTIEMTDRHFLSRRSHVLLRKSQMPMRSIKTAISCYRQKPKVNSRTYC